MLLTGYHRRTPGAIRQRQGHNKQRRPFRFTSNMFRARITCIWVDLPCRLYHSHRRLIRHTLVWGMVERRRRPELLVARCHRRQILCLHFDGQKASHKLRRMFMGVNMGVMVNLSLSVQYPILVSLYMNFACCRNVPSPLFGITTTTAPDSDQLSPPIPIQSHGHVLSHHLSFLVQAGHKIDKTFHRAVLKTS